MRAAKAKASATPSADIPLSEIEPLLAPISGADGIEHAGKTGLSIRELQELERAANWSKIQEITAQYLKTAAKDLEAAKWWVLSAVRQRAFPGARNGLLFLKSLLERYWDEGLRPAEPEDRDVALRWLNRHFSEALRSLPFTKRTDDGVDFSLVLYKEAASTGSEKDTEHLDETKRATLKERLREGKPSLEKWEEAVSQTEGSFYRPLLDDIQEIAVIYGEINVFLKGKLAGNAPELDDGSREILAFLELAERCLRMKGIDSPSQNTSSHETAPEEESAESIPGHQKSALAGDDPARDSRRQGWEDAVQSAQSNLPLGLAKMRALSSAEPTGRDLFYRKFALAGIYLGKGKTQPAKIILEDLAREIDELKLFEWESLSAIAEVWNKLCECRLKTGDTDGAEKLFERLCKLAPWHAVDLGRKDERS